MSFLKNNYRAYFFSCESKTLRIYSEFIKNLLTAQNIEVKIFFLPTKKKRFTLLKSPHVDKRAKEQFQIIYCKTIVDIRNIDSNNLRNILINKPKNIKIKLLKK